MPAARRIRDLASETRSSGGVDRPPSFVDPSGTNPDQALQTSSTGDELELERDRVAWNLPLPAPRAAGFRTNAARQAQANDGIPTFGAGFRVRDNEEV